MCTRSSSPAVASRAEGRDSVYRKVCGDRRELAVLAQVRMVDGNCSVDVGTSSSRVNDGNIDPEAQAQDAETWIKKNVVKGGVPWPAKDARIMVHSSFSAVSDLWREIYEPGDLYMPSKGYRGRYLGSQHCEGSIAHVDGNTGNGTYFTFGDYVEEKLQKKDGSHNSRCWPSRLVSSHTQQNSKIDLIALGEHHSCSCLCDIVSQPRPNQAVRGNAVS